MTTRAADDYDTILWRMRRLRRGCTCTISRAPDDQVRAVWLDPLCALHGVPPEQEPNPLDGTTVVEAAQA